MVYVTRECLEKTEILVFKHRDFPEAGIQVPAGTVKLNEKLSDAAIREVKEESGLDVPGSIFSLGRFEWFREDRNEIHVRNIFQYKTERVLPNQWEHKVSGIGEDGNLIFEYFWLDSKMADSALAVDQGKYINLVK